ncbi:MAG: Serine/threonine-protein kinase PknD (plasmid) [Chroococcopsis gigantea SAG 12.99]|jgi:serine/threonine protein kinase|nr:Serine/threonine-protein kinase PknD [Chroococcopsis gigantea SAG 12.99]
MSYCLNPDCEQPQNYDSVSFCQKCGYKLLLKERYRAIKPIGQGGFGKTFLAVDEDRPSKPYCVIKQFLPSSLGTDTLGKATELFNQEALRLDELGKHPQIPELYAHFEQEYYLYLIQEYIDGENLASLSNATPFSEEKIRNFLTNLSSILQFIHDRNVIHRDIKPENIIERRGDNSFVLVDFGASKHATNTALLKNKGTIIGDPRYMSPEQLLGKANFTSDLYCLGVTSLYLLTLVDPVELFDVVENKWVWKDYLKTSVSDELGEILDKMIARSIEKRFQSAKELKAALNNLSNDKGFSHILLPNNFLKPDQSLRSANGKYTLVMQADGNLVLYSTSAPLWCSNTTGLGGKMAMLEPDGNLVIRNDSNELIWRSGTGKFTQPILSVQDDGNVVIYENSGNPVWHTNTTV